MPEFDLKCNWPTDIVLGSLPKNSDYLSWRVLYNIFKLLFVPATKAYFKSIHVNNADVIPSKGPVIFACNHNSAFMDPILYAVNCKRTLHFLARGEAFNSAFSKAFYKKLKMLPIYRPETTPTEVYKNKFAFQACFEHLKNGNTIIIYPEGFSETVRRLRPIKNGIARIAFGAEQENDFSLNTVIIPVGLNYSDPHLFRSDVLINIGDPISVNDYKNDFLENEKEAMNTLTSQVQISMEKVIVHTNDERQESFIGNLEKLNHTSLETDLNKTNNVLTQKFDLTKDMIEKASHMLESDPDRFEKIESQLTKYIDRLNRLNLQDKDVSGYKRSSLIGSFLLLILGFPFALLGFIGNALPLALTALLSKKVEVREDFIGSLKLAGGMFIFLIYYVLIASFVANNSHWYQFFIFPTALYILGLYTLHYLKTFFSFLDDYKFWNLTARRPIFFEYMNKERATILDAIEAK